MADRSTVRRKKWQGRRGARKATFQCSHFNVVIDDGSHWLINAVLKSKNIVMSNPNSPPLGQKKTIYPKCTICIHIPWRTHLTTGSGSRLQHPKGIPPVPAAHESWRILPLCAERSGGATGELGRQHFNALTSTWLLMMALTNPYMVLKSKNIVTSNPNSSLGQDILKTFKTTWIAWFVLDDMSSTFYMWLEASWSTVELGESWQCLHFIAVFLTLASSGFNLLNFPKHWFQLLPYFLWFYKGNIP